MAVAIIDVRFPGRSAIDLGHWLLTKQLASRVLFLDHKLCWVRARLSNAINATYCSRDISLESLKRVTAKLIRNEPLTQLDHQSLGLESQSFRVDVSHAPKISTREMEIWTLIGEGNSVAQCAEIMGIAESTADNHKSRLMKKLDVGKSTELVRMAVRLGLVDP